MFGRAVNIQCILNSIREEAKAQPADNREADAGEDTAPPSSESNDDEEDDDNPPCGEDPVPA